MGYDAVEIGSKIRALRKARGYTQQQLAEKIDVQRATISNYEIGRRSPRIKDLEKIASYLGVSLQYFGFNDMHNRADLLARAEYVFSTDNISADEKAEIYKEIMKMYLNLSD